MYDNNDWSIEAQKQNEKQQEKRLRHESRDEKGRLKKGSRIAAKRNCDEYWLRTMYDMGYSVKKISELKGCSKSTVYNAIKDMPKRKRADSEELDFK